MLKQAIAHLGESTTNPRLEAFLLAIPCRCPLEPDDALSFAQERVDALGIEFLFDRRSAYFGEDSLDLFLSGVVVYGPAYASSPELRPYAGDLVRSLTFSMGPADVRKILGKPSKTANRGRKVVRDHWFYDAGVWNAHKTDLVIHYSEDGKSIRQLAVMIPHPSREA
ncbi:MAG: hypothetical protein IPK82_07395 [Polyangiaceae bacterium]|nr:hypothetical protein [Polyangiaceae bacterium]